MKISFYATPCRLVGARVIESYNLAGGEPTDAVRENCIEIKNAKELATYLPRYVEKVAATGIPCRVKFRPYDDSERKFPGFNNIWETFRASKSCYVNL